MPHITVNYRMYLPGGHHRQPRNTDTDLSLAPTAGGDTPFTPPFFPQLPYTLPATPASPGGSGMAQLLFWNVTDGTTGKVQPPTPLDFPTAASPLSVTAWYYPISGPGVGPNGIIDDAFSAAAGKFIDDTFVVVNGDPNSQMTKDANVIGFVPTTDAVTLAAKGTVASTPEPFSQWILNSTLMPVGHTSLKIDAKTNGIAIAVYQQAPQTGGVGPVNVNQYNAGPGIIIGGVKVDGGGYIIINGVPHPVDPWGPLLASLANSAGVAIEARNLDQKIGAQIKKLAAQDAVQSIKQNLAAFEKQAGL